MTIPTDDQGSLTIELQRSNQTHPHCFIAGGFNDLDSGGWVAEELCKAVGDCVKEKSEKIREIWHKYPEWWLILDDTVGYARHAPVPNPDPKTWTKVILLSRSNPAAAIELP